MTQRRFLAVLSRIGMRQGRAVPENGPTQAGLLESFDCCGFVVLHIEDGIQLGDLQQVVDFFGQVEQLQFATLIAHGGEGAHQLADA